MNVVETAQALVRIPSINPNYDPASGAEKAMVAWLLSWADRHGIKAELQEVLPGRANIVFTLINGASHPHLLWAAHMDTVAVADMRIPPFSGEIREGRIWGRGSADMKGPLAAMLHAFLALRDSPSSWHGTLTFACVVDEEFLARGIKALLKIQSNFDFAIVGEPSRLRPVRGCKGCFRFSFEAQGRAAHSSTPHLGCNAIVAMSHAVLEIERFFAEDLSTIQRPGFGSSTGSIGLIEGGSGINVVPESCRASVDIRLVPGQSWEEIYATLKKRISSLESCAPHVIWKFDETPFVDPPFEFADKSYLVQTALGLLGGSAEVVSYSCDASKIAAVGISCIILGPGDIACAHTADESIALDEIAAGVTAYTELAYRLLPLK